LCEDPACPEDLILFRRLDDGRLVVAERIKLERPQGGQATASAATADPPGRSETAPRALVRRYRAGEILAMIAAATGLPPSTVSWRLRRAGVELNSAADRGRARRLDLPDAEIVARYRAGETLTAIGRALGISAPTVRARLIEAGVERRRPGRQGGE
jgi:hypothetical protein